MAIRDPMSASTKIGSFFMENLEYPEERVKFSNMRAQAVKRQNERECNDPQAKAKRSATRKTSLWKKHSETSEH